jgi:propionyl-CoA carboxylase alpha chain
MAALMTHTRDVVVLRRVLVANRGEIARRIIRTLHDMGLDAVAVFSDADATAAHVAEADVAVQLPGVSAADTYLDQRALLEAARRSGADAVHPGYGFLAENAAFAQAVVDAGLTWIGPHPDTVALMGDKVAAKSRAGEVGVPVLAGALLDPDEPDRWLDAADQVGYPLLVKATAGGGGRGMHLVAEPELLVSAVESAQREAGSAFGDARVFLERFVPAARHVEVQVLGDHHGHRIHLHERDCSVQRRHQKVIEEAPAPGLSAPLRERLFDAALAVANAVEYVSLGTVEFLVDGPTTSAGIYFLEMNTRLQVEHTVTEEVTGLDLVRLQVEVAMGRPLALAQEDVTVRGHAIEARLYAEDPAADYLPQTGRLHAFEILAAPGLRVDSGVVGGDVVGHEYDAMLAKVVAHGTDRPEAVARLSRALRHATIHGLVTNRSLLTAVLDDGQFGDQGVTTAFLDERGDLASDPPDLDTVVLHAVAVSVAGQLDRRQRARVQVNVPSGWRNVPDAAQVTVLSLANHQVDVGYRMRRTGPQQWVDARVSGVRAAPVGVAARIWSARTSPVAADLVRVRVDLEVDGLRRTVGVSGYPDATWWTDTSDAQLRFVEHARFPDPTEVTAGQGPTAPVPGTVTQVSVAAGDRVSAGQALVVLEAMKMEHRVVAQTEGVVREVLVVVGGSVEAHELLVVLDAVPEAS